jgi:hypothetical protein
MRDTLDPSPNPQAPADPYCGNCGYSFKGLTASARCPECGKPIVEVLMRPGGFGSQFGKRYQSSARLFGLPVIDVALGPFGQERRGRARGIIAIGDSAYGWLAIGGLARGIVAVGGIAIGVFPVGGLAAGLLTAVGGLAASLGISSGGFSLGALSFGGLALGWVAQGGLAAGIYARGGLVFGKPFPASLNHLHWLLGNFPPNLLDSIRPIFLTLALTLVAGISICVLAGSQIATNRKPDEVNAN